MHVLEGRFIENASLRFKIFPRHPDAADAHPEPTRSTGGFFVPEKLLPTERGRAAADDFRQIRDPGERDLTGVFSSDLGVEKERSFFVELQRDLELFPIFRRESPGARKEGFPFNIFNVPGEFLVLERLAFFRRADVHHDRLVVSEKVPRRRSAQREAVPLGLNARKSAARLPRPVFIVAALELRHKEERIAHFPLFERLVSVRLGKRQFPLGFHDLSDLALRVADPAAARFVRFVFLVLPVRAVDPRTEAPDGKRRFAPVVGRVNVIFPRDHDFLAAFPDGLPAVRALRIAEDQPAFPERGGLGAHRRADLVIHFRQNDRPVRL